jgi:hypothetical protein
MSFYDRFVDGFPTSNKIISLLGGAKYYLTEGGKGFYAAADLGLVSVSYSNTTDIGLGFSLGVGYRTHRWDFSGRYNVIANANYASLGIAYVFRVK